MLFVVIEGRYEDCVKHMVGLITLLCKSEQLHDSSVLFPDDYFMNHYASEFNQDGRHRLMDLDFISYGNRVDSQRKSKVKSMFVVKYFSYDRQEYRIHNCDPYTGKTNDPTIIFHLGGKKVCSTIHPYACQITNISHFFFLLLLVIV